MRLTEAQSVIREVSGKTYPWLKAWGLSTVKEALRTIEDRISATDDDRELAFGVRRKIQKKW